MRLLYLSLAAAGASFAAPTPQGAPSSASPPAPPSAPAPAPATTPAAAPGGFDLSGILGLLGAAPGGAMPDLGSIIAGAAPIIEGLLGGASGAGGLGTIFGGLLGGGGAPANASIVIDVYEKTRAAAASMNEIGRKLASATDVATVLMDWAKAAEGVTKALVDGAKNINADKGKVDLMAAMGFQAPGDDLFLTTQMALDTIVANKAVIVKANASKQVVDALSSQKAAAIKLNEAIHNKMPMFADAIADAAGQKAVDAIDAVIKAFS